MKHLTQKSKTNETSSWLIYAEYNNNQRSFILCDISHITYIITTIPTPGSVTFTLIAANSK